MSTKKTAILIMDMQMAMLVRLPNAGTEVVSKAAEAIAAARRKDVLPIFIRLGYRNSMPEISPANKIFYSLKSMDNNQLQSFMEIHPDLGMTTTDIVVDKKRVSAFTGNDLDMILQAAKITDLVLCGISTSGIVLATFCAAFDKDFQLTVLSDACADLDEETHQHLIKKIFPKHSEVLTVAEWAEKE